MTRRAPTLALALCLLAAPPSRAQDAMEWGDDGLVARVNGRPILLSDLIDAALSLRIPVSDFVSGPGARGEDFRKALTAVIDEELLVQEAILQEIRIDELDAARRVDLVVQARVDEFQGGFEEFQRFLAIYHLGWKSFRRLMLQRERRRELATSAVARRITINPADVEDFRQRRLEAGRTVEEIFLAQIRVLSPESEAVSAEARRLRDLAVELATAVGREPERFSEIARARAAETDAVRFEVIGWIELESIRSPLREIVRRMHPGEVSDPIRVEEGWHVLYLNARHDARDLFFGEVFAREREKLLLELRDKATIGIDPKFTQGATTATPPP